MMDRKAYSFVCDDGFATKAFFSEELATIENLEEYGRKILEGRKKVVQIDIYEQSQLIGSVGK
jgi:hypothetical protein